MGILIQKIKIQASKQVMNKEIFKFNKHRLKVAIVNNVDYY